jgi:hypothetical protein
MPAVPGRTAVEMDRLQMDEHTPYRHQLPERGRSSTGRQVVVEAPSRRWPVDGVVSTAWVAAAPVPTPEELRGGVPFNRFRSETREAV